MTKKKHKKNLFLRRVLKTGIQNFWRNGWVSLATILIMVLALSMVGALLFSNVLLTSALSSIEEKVDISVYLKTTAPEKEILDLRDAIASLSEVDTIEYVSRDEALARFRARHTNNALITQSLEELEENPLGASLNIRAKNPDQYESIASFLESGVYASIIDKVNYRQNKVVIERLSNILNASRALGFGATLVLAIIAILVTFNTIRLAIYISRDEISVMRLVGAKNSYIRSPFVVEGILYGIISSIIVMVVLYPTTYWLGPKTVRFFGGPDLFVYFLGNFFEIFLLLLFIGVALGSISSFIATRRYLKV